jgi:hypothetical protein
VRIDMRWKKNQHQAEFDADMETKLLHLNGGFGSGKTYGLCRKLLKLSYINRDVRGGCVVPTIADFKKDMLPVFQDILESHRIRYRYHKGDKWFMLPWSRRELQIASAEKKIRGPNWGYAGINEVTLISQERYRETVGRVRLKNATCPQIASSGTPEGTSHWLYEDFVEKPLKNSRIIYGDTRNNLENLADDYVDTLIASYPQHMVDAYLKGMFVNMSTNRFYYAYDPHLNDDKSLARIPGLEVVITLDFNVDPMCATAWHIVYVRAKNGGLVLDKRTGKPMKKLLGFDQVELSGPRGADTHRMAAALRERGYLPESTTIYCDPAGNSRSTKGTSDVQILKQHQFLKIKFNPSAPHMRRRQLAVNNLLDKAQIQIHPVNCKGIKRDLDGVEQDVVTLGKVKDNPKLTHYSDGLDYLVDVEFPLSGTKPESSNPRIR